MSGLIMSGKRGDIDLNSNVMYVEEYKDLDGNTLGELTGGMGNSVDDGKFMNQSGDQIRVGCEGDQIRVYGGEGKEGGTRVVELETSDEGKKVRGFGSKEVDGVMGAEGESEVRTNLGVKGNMRMIGYEAVDGHVRCTYTSKEKEDVSWDGRRRGNDVISLVVDLNMDRVVNGETQSSDVGGSKVFKMKNLAEDPNATVLDGLVENAANNLNTFDNGDRALMITRQETCITEDSPVEKEGEFHVTDLVWGKVKSHPWWPGQICDPSSSTKMALKLKKKDCYLIAYFGDQTFAWNDASCIKPFRMYFNQMEKQQSDLDSFTHAVCCALQEVSRRVEYGLACSCLPKEVFSKVESQVIVNSGIRKQCVSRAGGDSFSTAASFVPDKLVQYLRELAEAPLDATDRLKFVTTRAQLLAFNRWKGYGQLPSFEVLNGLLEDNDISVSREERYPDELANCDLPAASAKMHASSEMGSSIIHGSSSANHRHITADGTCSKKRKKCMSDLISQNCPHNENELEEKTIKKNVSSLVDFIPTHSEKLFEVGDRIRKVASQLSGSASVLRFGESTSPSTLKTKCLSHIGSLGAPCLSSKEVQNVYVEHEYPPADEMLLSLSMIANDPLNGSYNNPNSTIRFFSYFRNSICLERKICQLSNEMTDKLTLEGMQDSFWTDIKGTSAEQIENECGSRKEMPSVDDFHAHTPTRSYQVEEKSNVIVESGADKTVGHANEEPEYSPTVFILNFSDSKKIPSEANLNKIFSRHGPLIESDTQVLKKSNRAKVVFKRRADAERAFSSTGKFSIFGPSLLSYRLNYSPSPRKPSTQGKKRKRKDLTSLEGKGVDCNQKDATPTKNKEQ